MIWTILGAFALVSLVILMCCIRAADREEDPDE